MVRKCDFARACVHYRSCDRLSDCCLCCPDDSDACGVRDHQRDHSIGRDDLQHGDLQYHKSRSGSDSEGVSATGTGNIVINFRQGSTETQAPSAVGLNAKIPVPSVSSTDLLRSAPK